MTEEQFERFVKITIAIGFAAGCQWVASDKSEDTCAATMDETLEQNREFIRNLARIENVM